MMGSTSTMPKKMQQKWHSIAWLDRAQPHLPKVETGGNSDLTLKTTDTAADGSILACRIIYDNRVIFQLEQGCVNANNTSGVGWFCSGFLQDSEGAGV